MTLYLITHGEYSDFSVDELIEGPPNSTAIIESAGLELKKYIAERREVINEFIASAYAAFLVDNPEPPNLYQNKFGQMYPSEAAILNSGRNASTEELWRAAQTTLDLWSRRKCPFWIARDEWNKKYSKLVADIYDDEKKNAKTIIDFLPSGFTLIEYEMINSGN